MRGLVNEEKNLTITHFYSNESEGIVLMKLWKHSGGIAFSQLQLNNYFGLIYKLVRVRLKETILLKRRLTTWL